MKDKQLPASRDRETDFFQQISDVLISARKYAKQQLDNTIVITYYEIGRMIVEREQQGKKRAQYGAELIKGLSEYLTEHFGRGFSVPNLKCFRQFYQMYSPRIQQSLTAKSEKGQSVISQSQEEQTLKTQSQTGKTPSTQPQKGQTVISQSRKGQTLSVESQKGNTPIIPSTKGQTPSTLSRKGQSLSVKFRLSWSHYLLLNVC